MYMYFTNGRYNEQEIHVHAFTHACTCTLLMDAVMNKKYIYMHLHMHVHILYYVRHIIVCAKVHEIGSSIYC